MLELARVLMAKPKMVLLDEPGAGVNRTLLQGISQNILLASVERDITFVIIEHDMRFVMAMCDPIYRHGQRRRNCGRNAATGAAKPAGAGSISGRLNR